MRACTPAVGEEEIMWLEAVVSKEDLGTLVARIVPLRVRLGQDVEADHYIELVTATNLALVADEGLRMTTQARIHWPVLGITVPIKIDPLNVMIRPCIIDTAKGEALCFTLEIEHADVAGIPAFGDRTITDKINRELAERHVEIAWAFASMLSHRFLIPPLLEPIDSLAFNVAWGKVRVTDEAMVLAISFHAEVSRRDDAATNETPTNGAALALPRRRALTHRRTRIQTPHLKQVALVGGTTLAIVGTYFTLRGAGRMGSRLLRRAFPRW
jgi:hypothetical protein